MEMIGGVRFMNQIDRQRIEAGVTVRTIRFRKKDVAFRTSAGGAKFLRELRCFFSSKKERFGMLIESTELTELMNSFWLLLWQRCEAARSGEG